MNILLLQRGLAFGGAEKNMIMLANHLSELGHNVDMFLFSSGPIDFDTRCNLFYLSNKNPTNFLLKLVNNLIRIMNLNDAKKKNDYDFAISFLDLPNLFNLITKKTEKTIISIRNTKKFNLLEKLTLKFKLKAIDKIVYVSEAQKKRYINKKIIEKSTVINNGFNINEIEIKSKNEVDEFEINDWNKYLISVANFKKQKNHQNLLRIFKRLLGYHQNLILILVGDGKYKSKIQSLVQKMKITDKVLFIGKHDNPYKFYRIANLTLLTSFYEGFPNVVIESLLCKTRVISSDCRTGPKEILENQSLHSINEEIYENELGALLPIPRDKYSRNIWIEYLSERLKINEVELNNRSIVNNYSDKRILMHWERLLNELF